MWVITAFDKETERLAFDIELVNPKIELLERISGGMMGAAVYPLDVSSIQELLPYVAGGRAIPAEEYDYFLEEYAEGSL